VVLASIAALVAAAAVLASCCSLEQTAAAAVAAVSEQALAHVPILIRERQERMKLLAEQVEDKDMTQAGKETERKGAGEC
jgi:type IV pilus biogenesis protein CpaD/CtpE